MLYKFSCEKFPLLSKLDTNAWRCMVFKAHGKMQNDKTSNECKVIMYEIYQIIYRFLQGSHYLIQWPGFLRQIKDLRTVAFSPTTGKINASKK